ncbi:MAG: hypothetical protein ABIJ34_04855 [archaeon]
MKKVFFLAILLVLLISFAAADLEPEPVVVETGIGLGIGVSPQNSCPEILQEHGFSVWYQVDTWVDYQTTLLDFAFISGWAGRSYAFEGEEVIFNVTVLDKDGIVSDCVHTYVTLDNGYDPIEAGCILIWSEDWTDNHTHVTYTDALGHFQCIYTVEPTESNTTGEYWISVRTEDTCGSECVDDAAGVLSLFLNPEVSMTISSQDQFGFLYDAGGDMLTEGPYAGETVYTPYFRVENSANASSGLYILLRLYATDMWDFEHQGSLCPDSNILTADNIEYKASHLNVQQDWTTMPRNEEGIDYIFNDFPTNFAGNFLGVGDDITMRMRLHIPSPCIGQFMDGGELVFVGEVI